MEVTTAQFEAIVDQYYEALFRFAVSLTRDESSAGDLVQNTFLIWAKKGHQIQDASKVKSWLFTTLHREFLGGKRRQKRFPTHEVESVERELPTVASKAYAQTDAGVVLDALDEIAEVYRVPLTLFYMQQHSYQEIAEQLDVPIGTVMSRLSRGKAQLRSRLSDTEFLNKPKGNPGRSSSPTA